MEKENLSSDRILQKRKTGMALLVSLMLMMTASLFQVEAQHQDRVREFIEQAVGKDTVLRGAVIGAMAIRLKDGETVLAYQDHVNMIPASCMKVITTGSGLKLLGADFRFATRLFTRGKIVEGVLKGDLILSGGGDPSLGSAEFPETQPERVLSAIREAIQSANIQVIEGRILADPEMYTDQPVISSWQWEDFGNGYGAGPRGLNWKDNSFEITLTPAKNAGEPASVSAIPLFIAKDSLNNRVITGTPGSKTVINVFSVPEGSVYRIEGTLSPEIRSYTVKGAVTRPAGYLVFDVQQDLEASGVRILNKLLPEDSPRNLLVTLASPPYSQLAKKTNEKSINLFAEAIFKYLGVASSFGKSYSGGKAAVDSLMKSMDLKINQIKLEDGSGLSRKNNLSANFICSFLQKMYDSPDFEEFLGILPRGGAGNLSRFLRESPLQASLRAKSGSMSGILNYCGYLKNASGEWISYSVMVNHYVGEPEVVRNFHEKIVELLAETERNTY